MKELRTAWRNLLRNRFHSGVNIFGLTIGLTACMLVSTVVIDELSYDKQWSKSDRLYRVLSVNKVGEGLYNQNSYSFAGLTPALKQHFNEVEEYCYLNYLELQLQLGEHQSESVKTNVLTSDTAIFHMLDLHILKGNPKAFKTGHANLILTKSYADKFFRNQKNLVGKTVYDKAVYQEKPQQYLITGIVKDLPSNTHLRADVIVLGDRQKEQLSPKQTGSMSPYYVLLRPGTNPQNFTEKIDKWYKTFVTTPNPLGHALQPISDIYLNSPFAPNQHVRGDRQQIIIFSAVAALLLIIACINFVNLSTAQAAARMGDIAIRKLLGAERKHIAIRVFLETLLFFGSATILALALYFMLFTPVELFLGHSLDQTIFSDPIFAASALGILLFAALVSGSYPALLISGFRPAGMLNGSLMSNRGSGRSFIRQALVVVQFSLCISVLIAVIVVHQQLKYIEKADVGFNKINLINIGFISFDGKAEVLRNEINRIPGVVSTSRCLWTPSRGPGFMASEVDDPLRPGHKLTVWHVAGDANFAQTLGLRLIEGRYLDASFHGDVSQENGNSLITATTARMLRIEKFGVKSDAGGITPVGIIEDFHNKSFHEALGPTVVSLDTSSAYGNMIVRVKAGAAPKVQAAIRTVWARLFPQKLLELDLVTEMLDRQYEREHKLQQLFTFFGALTMLLASLGIFALIVHSTQERVREIAIRKVLGGSVPSIAWLLSSQFSKLVGVAIIIASPFAMWSMTRWLESFAFRINLNWTIPVIAGTAALAIAMLTVSWQAIKAALANPVENLRNQ